jgi:PhnB protein
MGSRLNPYIAFTANAREAMEFYRDVFGGKLTLSTFGEFGTDGPAAELIMHGQLETDNGYTLMGADTPPGMDRADQTYVTLSLSGDDPKLRDYWSRLSDGGTVGMPLEKQVWGDEFGELTDRFGIRWMVNITGEDSGGQG